MALMKLVSPHTLVYLSIFLCILVDLGYSEDVPYTFEGESPEPIVIIDDHNIYKRAVGTNDTNNINNGVTTEGPPTTAGPNVPPVPTTAAPAPPTTAAPVPTTKAPSGGGVTTEPTTPLTTIKIDDHKYYHSQILPPEYVEDHWVEQKDAVKHKTLSDNYRVAVSVQMSFKFRFYGHEINSVTIATGGFLYMSPFLHKWLTATQYIAPLMGNFDTNLGNTSEILYKDYKDMFIVEWSDIYLQDQNHTNPFVFQTQLYDNGTIKFIYKKLPLAIAEINRSSHPVKIGLSDAYYIDSSVNGKNRRTIYEYHRVEVDTSLVREGTVIILHPKKTCNLLTDCDTCVTDKLGFDCKWCGEIQRCSDGVDWNRQSWRDKGCTTKAGNANCDLLNNKNKDLSLGIVIAVIVLLLILIGSIGGWVFYAYRNPTSSSGMWLMEHRPSQMKQKMAKMKFWKKTTSTGEKYEIRSEAEA
ncbi:plexin domain-containing protein 1-like [Mizuhopecten yessoensis]|uniref:plexin domain-containing protein 1-like n=1 Tax=Mizuhopecten yessoensis TaxID=6573 RepID=UPI000B45EA09|nr:plexin domain-containing protein 1-like [Mizuhopecten yessoensis]